MVVLRVDVGEVEHLLEVTTDGTDKTKLYVLCVSRAELHSITLGRNTRSAERDSPPSAPRGAPKSARLRYLFQACSADERIWTTFSACSGPVRHGTPFSMQSKKWSISARSGSSESISRQDDVARSIMEHWYLSIECGLPVDAFVVYRHLVVRRVVVNDHLFCADNHHRADTAGVKPAHVDVRHDVVRIGDIQEDDIRHGVLDVRRSMPDDREGDGSLSQYWIMLISCGAKFHKASTSDRMRPRFNRWL